MEAQNTFGGLKREDREARDEELQDSKAKMTKAETRREQRRLNVIVSIEHIGRISMFSNTEIGKAWVVGREETEQEGGKQTTAAGTDGMNLIFLSVVAYGWEDVILSGLQTLSVRQMRRSRRAGRLGAGNRER